VWIVTVLSLAAAVLFATAAFLQQQGIRATLGPEIGLPVLQSLTRFVRHPVWIAGWCTNLVGFMCQAAALHLGAVALVQPLLVTQLLFTLFLVSMRYRRRPDTRALLGSAALCCGLVVFLTVDGAAPLSGEPDRPRVLLAVVAAAGLVVLLVSSTAGHHGLKYVALPAVAAGICFALSAVFMKLTADDLLARGVAATARDWPGYCLAISTVCGLLIEQAAFASGPLTWAVAAMNITNPLVSYAIGVLAFDVSIPTDPGSLARVAAAGLLIVVGVSGLSHVAQRGMAVRPSDVPAEPEHRSDEASEEVS
jgi:multisubunit Na+/H+ antiporter MnhG subunit